MSNLSVKLELVDAGFAANIAVAKARVTEFSGGLKEAAREALNFDAATAASSQAVQQAAANYAQAKGKLAELNEQMKATRQSSGGMGGAIEEIRTGLSTAFQVTGIAAAVQGVRMLGDAVQNLGAHAIEIRSLSEVLGVTTSQLQAMQVAGEESGTSIEVLARAGERLTTILTQARDGSGAAVEKLHALGISTADIADPTFQLNELLAVLKTRLTDTISAEQTRKALLQELGARTALAVVAIKEYDGSTQGVAAAMARVNGLSTEQIERLKGMKTWWSELGTTIANAASKALIFASSYASAAAASGAAVDTGKAAAVSGPGRVASSTGEQQGAQDSARQQEALHNEVLHSEMESIKEGVAATAQGSADRLAALRRYAADAKKYYGADNVDEVRKANAEVLAAERAYRETQGREAIASAKEQIQALSADTKMGLAERLDAERQIWVGVLTNDKVVGAQRVDAAREWSREYTEIARQTAAQASAIARQDADTDVAISRILLEAQKSSLDAGVVATQAAVAQKYAALRDLANREYVLNLQSLANEQSTLLEGTAAYEAAADKMREIAAKLTLDLAKFDQQQAADAKRVAKEQESAWHGAVGEIENAESAMVGDLLNKRKTLSQALLSVGANLVTQEIANDLKAFTTRMLLQDQDKALQQGGLLYHGVVEAQKAVQAQQSQITQTAANATGNAARTAADAAAATESKGVSAAAGGSQVMADAAKTFAGIYANVSQIPVVGWILAPVAAAAGFAAVAAYEGLASLDTGTNWVPRNMVAQLHQGEAVVPRAYNPAAEGGGFSGGGGDTHVHNWNIRAWDGSSVRDLIHSHSFRDEFARSMSQYLSRGGRG